MLKAARDRAEEEVVRVSFLEGRADSLPFSNDAFDLVCAVTVLCFLEDANRALREMERVVRPGGRLVVGELGRLSLWAAVRRLRGRFGSATWGKARFRDAGELRKLVERAGFAVEAMRGVAFYPPFGLAARLMAPLDAWLGRRTTFGAAFIAFRAVAVADLKRH
jgi:SAM-dependent methyltransferase